jgi:hypothetical protein
LRRILISKLEVNLKSKKITDYQSEFTSKISNRIQAKIKSQQELSNCENSNKLICNLQGKTPYELGLGCQMHTYASGLLCAIENNRKYFIVNYRQKQFSNYFDNFVKNCAQDKYLTIQQNVNDNKIQYLCNLFLYF